ncbi:hypothetical protein GQ42DRAFT_157204 [Ramicandelaber brevisporus]|nr:hypothetical protein GQ42DRAFT_157204 [Ramicandelaber brevisporus]
MDTLYAVSQSLTTSQLPHHVSIQRASFDSYQKSGAMAIAKWIAGSEQRNQDVDFEWTLSRSWHDTLNWLDEWVILINKPELHSFTLTISKDTLNGKHVGSFMAKVASVLVDLTINPSENTSIGDFKTFFHSTKDVVFSRLKQLYLQLPARSRDYSDNDAAVITARCFPVLESLDISESEYGKRESLSLMVDGYFTAAKYMQLEYCNNKLWNVFIKSVPNLETLNLYFSTVTINPAIMAAHLPKLEQLIIDSACDVSYLLPLNGNTRIRHAGEHNDQLKSLKILDTHCDSTTEDPTLAVLQFVLFYAPAIDTFRISYVFPSIEPIIRDNLHGATNNSLRRLSITYFIIMDFRVEQVETVVSLFPMLEKLHVTNFSPFDQPTEVLKERFPRLSIEPLI